MSESAGIGRQARLRGVCLVACGFKSHLSHQIGANDMAFAPTFLLKVGAY